MRGYLVFIIEPKSYYRTKECGCPHSLNVSVLPYQMPRLALMAGTRASAAAVAAS